MGTRRANNTSRPHNSHAENVYPAVLSQDNRSFMTFALLSASQGGQFRMQVGFHQLVACSSYVEKTDLYDFSGVFR